MIETPTNPSLIAFIGYAGSGKTTALNWVVRNHTKALRLSFAAPLKAMVYTLLKEVAPKGWPVPLADYTRNAEMKEQPIPFMGGITARRLMQTLGTEWGRNAVHPDFWVSLAAMKVERVLGSSFRSHDTTSVLLVCDDARFENEVAMLRAYDARIVRIIRPDAEKDASVSDHASEGYIDTLQPDVTIVNDGTVADLEAKLATMFPAPPKK